MPGNQKKQKKIKKYRKPLNLNIGMIIFGAVFIYVLYCVMAYFQTSHIVRYEVQEGSLATDNIYRGVIIREEVVATTQAAGYVNYYAREGERVAKNDLVYTIDETGRLSEYLEDLNLGENSLSTRELLEFRSEIVNYMHGFDERDYETIYDFKNSLKSTVLRLANSNMLESIQDMNGESLSNVVNFCNAETTGVVAYWTDGYEELTTDQVSGSVFEEEGYEKTTLVGNDLKAVGDVAYKLSVAENWSLVIPMDAERGAEMQEAGYIKVRFLKNQYEAWGLPRLYTGADGGSYLELSFTNSMISFISDRFLEVELILHDETGLKIPNSSIVQKEFYLIPEDYVVAAESSNGVSSVTRQCYLEDGTISSEYVEVDVYHFDTDTAEYYLDASALNAGDILYKLDSQETYTVSRKATLTGVYNMNKGYADFKQIIILYQNEEYAIVKANTQYGLNVYDYIVLNAEAVTDDQFINE